MRKVEGYDYLYQRGSKYLVRMQVPEPLRALLGKGELKKSLGGDLSEAVRNRHKVIADFQGIIGSSQSDQSVIETAGSPSLGTITRQQVLLSVSRTSK